MWRIAVAVMLFVAGMRAVYGDETGVLNEPSKVVTTLKTVVDTLSPQGDTLYNFWDTNDDGGEWLRGLSIGLWTFKPSDIPVGSLRVGYIGEDHNFTDARGWYAGANLDLPGLTKFIPEKIKGIATTGYLDAFWKIAGKYGRVGVVGGRDADRQTPIVAASFGLSATW